MQLKGEAKGITVVDDYGHHPTEIRATLDAVREAWPERRLVVAFQPHRFSRTRDLFDEFTSAFNPAEQALDDDDIDEDDQDEVHEGRAGDVGLDCLLEAGHVAQNILLQATVLDLASVPVGGFDPAAVAELRGEDPEALAATTYENALALFGIRE